LRQKKLRKEQLGLDYGTANNRLKKMLLYHLAQKLDMHWCFRCGAEIDTLRQFSVDHKIPWLHDEKAKELFWDLDNIAFSHLSCNSRDSRGSQNQKGKKCPALNHYNRGCRCTPCRELKSKRDKIYYNRKKFQDSNKDI
jgi:hypothetical protein